MKRLIILFYIVALLVLILYHPWLKAAERAPQIKNKLLPDTTVSAEIKRQLNEGSLLMHYPKTVKRFYGQNRFDAVWTKPENCVLCTYQAMLMLDCVAQYGLSPKDYHQLELQYGRLQNILESPGKVSIADQVKFEIFLTDAMITFINNLHYGKLNPDFPEARIDNGADGIFEADSYLASALKQQDFTLSIAKVQPQSKQYLLLQDYMRLVKGQYTGDCYETPAAEVRAIAVNLERLRWASITEDAYIQINIPSFSLKFHQPDSTYTFKVIVGKPANQTPTLQSAITHFTTAPEWKVPAKIFVKELLPKAIADNDYLERNNFSIYDKKGGYISPNPGALARVKEHPSQYGARQSAGCDNALGLVVFRFANPYDVYVHDTPDQTLFNNTERAYSHGCIRVQNAQELARLLLQYTGVADRFEQVQKAMAKYKTINFTLPKAVPIKVTYVTCEVQDGKLQRYKDIYDLDKRLEMALFQTDQPIVAL